MTIAPEPILRASLRVLHVAGYTTRNWTLPTGSQASHQQINDLWEALHEVPFHLCHWDEDEKILFHYFDWYAAKWPEPRLREIYEKAKEEGGL